MSAEVGQEENKPDINGIKMEKPNDNQNRNPDNRRGGYGGRGGGRFNGNQRGKPGDMKVRNFILLICFINSYKLF